MACLQRTSSAFIREGNPSQKPPTHLPFCLTDQNRVTYGPSHLRGEWGRRGTSPPPLEVGTLPSHLNKRGFFWGGSRGQTSAPGQKPDLAGGSQLEMRLAQALSLALRPSPSTRLLRSLGLQLCGASIVWLWFPASAEF